MTPKQQVTTQHKDAKIEERYSGSFSFATYYVVSNGQRIGAGRTKNAAWRDAASKLNQPAHINNL